MTDIQPDPPFESRRTGPQLRDAIRRVLRDSPYMSEVEPLLKEMERRSPKWKVARPQDPDPDPETILAIRKYNRAVTRVWQHITGNRRLREAVSRAGKTDR